MHIALFWRSNMHFLYSGINAKTQVIWESCYLTMKVLN